MKRKKKKKRKEERINDQNTEEEDVGEIGGRSDLIATRVELDRQKLWAANTGFRLRFRTRFSRDENVPRIGKRHFHREIK